MATHYEFNCFYEDGSTLWNQTYCAPFYNGFALVDTEARLVETVTSKPIPWWLLVLALLAAWQNGKGK